MSELARGQPGALGLLRTIRHEGPVEADLDLVEDVAQRLVGRLRIVAVARGHPCAHHQLVIDLIVDADPRPSQDVPDQLPSIGRAAA